jgi:lysophospholipase L1-like esterase
VECFIKITGGILMKIYFNSKIYLVVSSCLVSFAVNSAPVDASIKKIDIETKPGSVLVSPFKYIVSGREMECKGKSFKIMPTKLKEMKMDIMLQQPAHRDDVWVYMPNKLPARNIVDFKLFDNTGKELKENADYRLDRQGAVSQLKGKKGAPRKKPISTNAVFSYLPDRYDSIFLDPKNSSLSFAQGVARNVDAEEYIPATPEGKIRLCNIAVTGDKIRVIPTYEKRTTIVKGDLTAFHKKLKSGKPIKLLGYGDSITAVQTRGQIPYEPNSKVRDRYERYLFRYPEDTVNLVEKFDFEDGAGKKRCKIGWNWRLAEAIEKKYGNKVEYLNCGIGGTRSDATKKQGLYPDRIKAALDAKPDIVVLAFGMNELGSARTEKNTDEIIKKFKAIGADVIVMGVPQINGARVNIMDRWKKTNDDLKRVAQSNNCPFVDTTQVNLGIAPEHICSANQYNHPGINELKKYGEALAGVLK